MTVRDILVPIRGDGKGEGVLDHALAVARRFNGFQKETDLPG
jgi:hypothetical protein